MAYAVYTTESFEKEFDTLSNFDKNIAKKNLFSESILFLFSIVFYDLSPAQPDHIRLYETADILIILFLF